MIRKTVREMTEYKPPLEGRSGGHYLLLDFNERTTELPKHVLDAVIAFVQSGRMHLYPEYGDVPDSLSRYVGCDSSQLMITNGSDQGIDVIFRATTEPGDEAIVPVPTFAMLQHTAELQGLTVYSPQYSDDFAYPLEEVLSLVSERTRIIVVCNPNSPHGTLLSAADILKIARTAPKAAVLVDECYFEYSKETVVQHVEDYPNLFVTRTFSKTWGLASLRIGYLVSAKSNITELLKVRGPYDINVPAVVALQAALRDPAFMQEYTREVIEESRPFFEEFLKERGIFFIPSEANFVLAFPDDVTGMEQHLRQNGILVRPRSGAGIEGSLRFSIGTMQDMKRTTSILTSFLED